MQDHSHRQNQCPDRNFAIARVQGGPLRPQIRGTVTFQDVPGGTNVCIEVRGLPPFSRNRGEPPVGPHGFHIHEHGNCDVGNSDNPFMAAGEHWNPDNQPHGNHAGDFPVLFSNKGFARMCFFTSRFRVSDIINRSVIIHESPDDYRTQPSGNSGRMLACGVITRAQIDRKEIPCFCTPRTTM